MATNETPVYLFTGFLEGGKTHIIQESLSDPSFNTGEKTLILMCEEGEEELDPSMFAGQNCRIEYVENQDDINPENLTRLFLAHKTDRVVIEYNGMWQLNQLYQSMPQGWFVFQEMMFADASTFLTYNANMRQLMVDKLTGCEMVVLNRTLPESIRTKFTRSCAGFRAARRSVTITRTDMWSTMTSSIRFRLIWTHRLL